MRKALPILICVGVLARLELLLSGETTQPDPALAHLSKGTREKVEDLARRIREQRAKLWSLPDSAKLIRVSDELNEFCTASDLVELLGSDQHGLRQGAFQLLVGSHNGKLSGSDIKRLLTYLEVQNPRETWKGQWAGRVLVRNETLGIPVLVKALGDGSSHFTRVNAACALASREVKVNARVRREARLALLGALGNADDSARLAHNGIQPLESWIVERLTDTLRSAKMTASLWPNGTSLLASCDHRGHENALRSVFLRAVEHRSVRARMNGINGLRNLGLKKDDLPLYQALQKDDNAHVRRMLYVGLRDTKEPWVVPLLVAGLDAPPAEIVETCADGLARLGHRAAVPKLIEVLKTAPTDAHRPFGSPYRSVGDAIAQLTGQEYDFAQRSRCVGNAHIRARVIDNRDDTYRREAARALRWWEETGSRQKW